MKRSEINNAIIWARDLLKKNNYRLPDIAYWTMDEWNKNADKLDTVRKVMLGWDVSDFGNGDYEHLGAVLYTVRNGHMHEPGVGVPYCEKYIIMADGQRLPNHYHVHKTEDIINRAGGELELFLWNADENGNRLDTDVHVFMDGIEHVVKAGEPVYVSTGNSISLTPYIAHVFGPKPGSGDIIVGEVSKINDDVTDNYFLEGINRYSVVEEDEPMLSPLCNEYEKI